jgi:serine protease inhibitor
MKLSHRSLASLLAIVTAWPATALGQVERGAPTAVVVKDSNAFALSLYDELANKDGNLFFSPYSISTALAMTYAGARGETAEQMAKALHFAQDADALHAGFGRLIAEQNAGGKKRGYQLAVANALWGQSGFAFQPDFLALLDTHYAAGLREVDFMSRPEAVRRIINDWAEKETNGKIKDLIAEGKIDKDMRLVLTNAIYFKSAWLNSFSDSQTKKDDFFTASDKKVRADMMHRNGKYALYQDEDVQVLDMPYARRDLSLIAVLPRQKDGLARLEKNVTLARLEGWLKDTKDHQVDVKFPKFKMTQELDLKKALSALGMPVAFTAAADFSGISSQQRLHIGFVLHKAFIDLNERGTEAAAATAVGIAVTSAPLPPRDKAVFHADHPFLFLIRDNRTGAILFLGRVVRPG